MDVDLEYIRYGERKILIWTFKGEVMFENIIVSWQHCLDKNLLTKDVIGALLIVISRSTAYLPLTNKAAI